MPVLEGELASPSLYKWQRAGIDGEFLLNSANGLRDARFIEIQLAQPDSAREADWGREQPLSYLLLGDRIESCRSSMRAVKQIAAVRSGFNVVTS